jgi:hypothetical protein
MLNQKGLKALKKLEGKRMTNRPLIERLVEGES